MNTLLQALNLEMTVEAPSKKIAIFITSLQFRGKAAMYKLVPAYEGFDRVVVSSVTLPPPFGTETLVFSVAPGTNEVQFENELIGFRPEKSHRSALFAIGYELQERPRL